MSRVQPPDACPAPIRLVLITTVPQSLFFFTGQVGYLQAHGFEVHAVAAPGKSLETFAVQEYVVAHAVEMTRQITPRHDLLALVRLWRLLHKLRPQIVQAGTPKGGLLGIISAWLAGVPVRVYQIHGLPMMTATGRKRIILRWSERIACALADQVLCVSHSIREVAIAERLCPADKITVLLGGSVNGIDTEKKFNPQQMPACLRDQIRAHWGIPSNALVVGYVGRIVRDKGITELAEAWKLLREEFPLLHLLVVGPLEPQDPVPSEVIALLETDPRVHLTGWMSDLPPLYAAMDIVALPTYREGFPVTPLEAAAMALPIVATRIPGCVDAVQDGVTGTLVPPCSAGALADALRAYLHDPALRQRHGSAARGRAQRDFQQQAIWEAVRQEHQRLLTRACCPNDRVVNTMVEDPAD